MSEKGKVEDRFNLVGHELEGKFRVENVVAEGGFGVVYAATHLTLQVTVALKVLKSPPDMTASMRAAFIEKFLLEARTVARIRHANIVQVMDTGVSKTPNGETAPWMVLEWISGETMERFLTQRRGQGGMKPDEALALLRPVFDALAFAHDAGVAHRDVKPGNIMLTPGKRGPTVRLLDFGIAKLMEPEERAGTGITKTNNAMNAYSPQYGAPEQVGSARTGPWTDVHALGLILTEMLCARGPISGANFMEVVIEIVAKERPSPAKFGVDVGAWEPVIAKAVALKPMDRFANATEFLEALEANVPTLASATPLNDIDPLSATFRADSAEAVEMANIALARTGSSTTLRGSATSVNPPAPAVRRNVTTLAAIAGAAMIAVGGGSYYLLEIRGKNSPISNESNHLRAADVVSALIPRDASSAVVVATQTIDRDVVVADATAQALIISNDAGSTNPHVHRPQTHRGARTNTNGLGYEIP